MQREEDDGIMIVCDFTGKDWDQVAPMIEGHQGSVLSLEALALAVEQAQAATEKFQCTMCLRHFDPPEMCWRHAAPPPSANPNAVICWDCVQQADKAFDRDPDTEWTRKIAPTDRWR